MIIHVCPWDEGAVEVAFTAQDDSGINAYSSAFGTVYSVTRLTHGEAIELRNGLNRVLASLGYAA
jgi:hypothetical protein